MNNPSSEPLRTYLAIERGTASQHILAQIQRAEEFLPHDEHRRTFEELSGAATVWEDYTLELLKRAFTTDELADEFRKAGYIPVNMRANSGQRFSYVVDKTRFQINALKSIHGRLEFFDGGPVGTDAVSRGQAKRTNDPRAVFVVHGHDDGAKQTVARFLEKLGLVPVILHEKADQGRTIIEKFEDHADVGFAVVLLTPDDDGRARRSGSDLAPRARQNVILELGYFIGRLSRGKVCALKADGVEVPSDLMGVLYVPLDGGGAWRLILARELKAAGFNIDINFAV